MDINSVSSIQGGYVTAGNRKTEVSKEVNVELSEAEKLEAFKKEIWNEINRMPRCSSINWSIQITDGGFKRMMEDPAYRERIMSVLAEDAAVGRPPITSSMCVIDENDLKGCAYGFGYGEEAFEAHSNNKDCFYKKKATQKVDYEKLWEEQRLKKEQQREKINQEYFDSLVEKKKYNQKQDVANIYEKGTVVSESSI